MGVFAGNLVSDDESLPLREDAGRVGEEWEESLQARQFHRCLGGVKPNPLTAAGLVATTQSS
jgi:hypothetical protein